MRNRRHRYIEARCAAITARAQRKLARAGTGVPSPQGTEGSEAPLSCASADPGESRRGASR